MLSLVPLAPDRLTRMSRDGHKLPTSINKTRAERIGRAHACERCLEYSFKRLVVKPATPSHKSELGAVWMVSRTCGVCGLDSEIALDAEGDIIYG